MQRCPQCGLNSVESQESTLVCVECGHVVGESEIVNDVTFGETATGAATVNGTQISGNTGKHSITGPGGKKYGDGDSKFVTTQAAESKIRNICRQLGYDNLDLQHTAVRIFRVVLSIGQKQFAFYNETYGQLDEGNLVQGRKSLYTYGACIYLALRRKKLPIMLIEIADLCAVNVFTLGRAYLRLCQLMRADPDHKIEVVDPALYIRRFAAMLDFGDELEQVILDATRLCARFKTDWLVQGRRPSGITGACLLLAARMNNFRRSVAEIVQVVKVADITLKRRLDEFRQTPLANYSIEKFREMFDQDEIETALPPIVIQERKRGEKRKRREEEARQLEAETATLNAMLPPPPTVPSEWQKRAGSKRTRDEAQLGDEADDEQDIDSQLDPPPGRRSVSVFDASRASQVSPPPAREDPAMEATLDAAITEEVQGLLDSDRLREDVARTDEQIAESERRARNRAIGSAAPTSLRSREQVAESDRRAKLNAATQAWKGFKRPGGDGSQVGDEDAEPASTPPPTASTSAKGKERAAEEEVRASQMIAEEDPNDPLANLDEDELDSYLLSKEEEEIKERIWTEFNKEYLEEAMRKAIKEEEDLKNGIAPSRPRQRNGTKRGGPAPLRDSSTAAGQSAVAATRSMKHKFSSKINYSALENLFPGQSNVVGAATRGRGARGRREQSDGLGAVNMLGRAASMARSENSTLHGGESDYVSEGDDERRRPRRPTPPHNSRTTTANRTEANRRSKSAVSSGVSDAGQSDAYVEDQNQFDDGYDD